MHFLAALPALDLTAAAPAKAAAASQPALTEIITQPSRWVEFVGPNHALQLFGVKLVGVTAENGRKLLFSLIYVAVVIVIARLLRKLSGKALEGQQGKRVTFWTHQGVRLVTNLAMLLGLLSIWFNDPTQLATFVGLVTAGVAFALQKVVTSVAGYIVILRGNTFNVGDRITMGGVRGDVVALNFIQTTIMEMGQPPLVQSAEPAMWVRARQYTGRIVTVTNDKVFDEPVYNYTRDFPYIWEEISIPITYTADRRRAEAILLDAATALTTDTAKLAVHDLKELHRRYLIQGSELKPRVFMRLTDNWIELAVRFLTEDHGVRDVKDQMYRRIIDALDEAKIGIASSTYDIVGLPPLRVVHEPPASVAATT